MKVSIEFNLKNVEDLKKYEFIMNFDGYNNDIKTLIEGLDEIHNHCWKNGFDATKQEKFYQARERFKKIYGK